MAFNAVVMVTEELFFFYFYIAQSQKAVRTSRRILQWLGMHYWGIRCIKIQTFLNVSQRRVGSFCCAGSNLQIKNLRREKSWDSPLAVFEYFCYSSVLRHVLAILQKSSLFFERERVTDLSVVDAFARRAVSHKNVHLHVLWKSQNDCMRRASEEVSAC